jgi:hypothetical protein
MAWAGASRSAGATAVAVMTLFGGMKGHGGFKAMSMSWYMYVSDESKRHGLIDVLEEQI